MASASSSVSELLSGETPVENGWETLNIHVSPAQWTTVPEGTDGGERYPTCPVLGKERAFASAADRRD